MGFIFNFLSKHLFKIVFLIFLSSLAFNFFYIDLSSGCFIKLLPSWDLNFNTPQIKKGLKVLKNALPDDYNNICQRIEIIDPNLDCGGFEGGCYWSGNPKRISVSTADESLSWIAAIIVHETCHSRQDFEKRGLNESECYTEGDRVLRSLAAY